MRHLLVLLNQVSFVFAVFLTLGAWAAPGADGVTWAMRIGFPVVAAALLWPLLPKPWRREETLPDQLARAAGRYFERDGFCFAFVPAVEAGVSWMNIYFQNRYANPCHARVVLQSRRRFMSTRRLPFPRVDVSLECEGGAFGVCRTEWPIPAELRGQTFRCEIVASTRYPNGLGRRLRTQEGLRVALPANAAGRAALTAGLLLAGIRMRHATLDLRLPEGVADVPSHGTAPAVEILWQPDLPTGGFPVAPTSPALRGRT